MKRQLAKVQKIKAKIQTLIKLVGLGIKKYIVQLLELEAKLEQGQKEQMIQVGSRILRKNYGKSPVIAGKVVKITGDVATIEWEKGRNFSSPHNYKKEQKLKDLQPFSEERVSEIHKKRCAKAYSEFKEVVLQYGQNWSDDKKVDILWAINKGYIEQRTNKDKGDVTVWCGIEYRGVQEYRVTDAGIQFAATI